MMSMIKQKKHVFNLIRGAAEVCMSKVVADAMSFYEGILVGMPT